MQDVWLVPLCLMAAVLLLFPPLVGYLVLVERKVLADLQVRYGPMRVGPHGLLQPIADALKLFLKEDIVPSGASRGLFVLAPLVSVFTGLAAFALLPFSGTLVIADVNVGLLVVSAFGAVGILGVILGGWSSNSHYPLLGSLRSAAQLVSYEVALSLALVSGVMAAGTLSMVGIVEAQLRQGTWGAFAHYGLMLVPFFVYFVAALAETSRIPFDLPEAESELVGGYHTEYSGFRWALYMLAEYANVFVVSSVGITLFLGGWLRPFPNVAWLQVPLDYGVPLLLFGVSGLASLRMARRLTYTPHRLGLLAVGAGLVLVALLLMVPAVNEAVRSPFWFFLKLALFFYTLVWFRGTFPRFRYDQLMNVGWKLLIPLGLVAILANAVVGLMVG